MSYARPLCWLVLALLAACPSAAWAQAPLTKLYLQESASRDVEQNVLVATVQAHAEAASPAEAQAAVNETMAAAVDRVRSVAEIRAATGSYNVYQRYDRDSRPVGWVAEQDLRLTAKDPAAPKPKDAVAAAPKPPETAVAANKPTISDPKVDVVSLRKRLGSDPKTMWSNARPGPS